jgi:trigger factor
MKPSSASPTRTVYRKADGAKAETGDRVTISFKGSIDGVPFDGGTGEASRCDRHRTFVPVSRATGRHRGGETRDYQASVPEELRQ